MTLDTEIKRNWCWWLVGVLAVAGICFTYLGTPNGTPNAVLAPQSQILQKETTVKKDIAVQVYKPKVKKSLGLPAAIQESETKAVIAATDLPKSKHERTVTTVIDETTGEATQYVQEKPLPLFAKDSSGHAGLYLGFKNLEPAVRAEVHQDVFAIKALTLGVTASADVTQSGNTDTFIGIGGRFEW